MLRRGGSKVNGSCPVRHVGPCTMPPMTKTPRKPGAGRGTGRGDGPASGPGPQPRRGGRGKAKAPGWLPPAPPAPRGGARPPASRGGQFVDPHAGREAERYAEPIASREAILQLLDEADGPLTMEMLA